MRDGVAAGEPLEDVVREAGGQPGAVVVDGTADLAAVGCAPTTVTVVPGGVWRRALPSRLVTHLVQPLLVAGHGHRLVGQVELPAVVRGDDAGVTDGLESQVGEVDLVAVERPAGVQPREQQQVLDQGGHPGGLGLDLGHRQGQLLRVGRAGAPAQLGVPVDGGQRRAQLVGGVGDELPDLQLAAVPLVEGLLDVGEHGVQRGTDCADLGALVGEVVGNPHRGADLAAGQRQRGHLKWRCRRPRAAAGAGGARAPGRRRRPPRPRPARAAPRTTPGWRPPRPPGGSTGPRPA